MSYGPEDAAIDQGMAELYEEHREQAIEEFTDERLQSYYRKNHLLAKPALDSLLDARNLLSTNPTASVLFAAIATEVGLKATLLKPIVYGLVHDESTASLITDLTISYPSMDKYRALLLQVLNVHGGVDLDTYKRRGSNTPLWEEIKKVQKIRNSLMHRAERASKDDADIALGTATAILEAVFPAVVKKMGLHLHDGVQICGDWKCQYKNTPFGNLIDGT